jgi:chaperonin GroEL
VIEKLKDFRNNGHQLLGYNCTTGKYVDLIEEGVVDPAKVTRIAIQNACSVAMTFLSLDAVVFDE